MIDQILGLGDGLRTNFALVKNYGDNEQVRRITRPKSGAVLVAVNSAAASGWTLVDHGVVVFETAPAIGAVVTAGFLFDVPVRFAEDRIEVRRATFGAGDMPSVPLIEIREAV